MKHPLLAVASLLAVAAVVTSVAQPTSMPAEAVTTAAAARADVIAATDTAGAAGAAGAAVSGAAASAPPAPHLDARTATVDAGAAADALPVMGDYRVSRFRDQAARLDPKLRAAVRRDLGLSAAEYLAEGQAAGDAATVLAALESRDSGVIDGRVSGTALAVYVSTTSAAALARSAGTRAVYGAPPVVALPNGTKIPLSAPLSGGQPYVATAAADSESGEVCSTGFNGYALATGAAQLVTAGHCDDAALPLVRVLDYTKPNDVISPALIGAGLGTWVPGSGKFGGGSDSALLAVNSVDNAAQPSVLTWGGGSGAPRGSAPMNVTGTTAAVVGDPICTSGATTGWTCGKVLAVDQTAAVSDTPTSSRTVNSIVTSACAQPGDSGGAALIGTAAAGIMSWGTDGPCRSSSFASGVAPIASSKPSKVSVTSRLGSVWEPAVVVGAVPHVTSLPSSKRVFEGSAISGTAAGAAGGDYVKVQFSGESKVRTASITSGKWSMSLAGLTPGVHSFTMRAAWGKYSLGSASSGTLTVAAKPVATRYAGADRYATSVAISKAAYRNGAKVVYVATGENYPDALSAGPIAATEHAPLLLTSTSLPSAVRGEIARLKPREIVIVGGVRAVPASVATALASLAPKVTRVAGSDRFETSRRLATRGFPGAAASVYLATGANFPDALAAGAAAGAHDAPVLLVKGDAALDGATRSFLAAKRATHATVVGGPAAVSNAFQSSVAAAGIAVTRLSGVDRYATSEVIGRVSFPSYRSAYFATGADFPDALAGSAVAGAKGVPLFTVPGRCVPRSVVTDILVQGDVTSIVLLGGGVPIADAVGRLTTC